MEKTRNKQPYNTLFSDIVIFIIGTVLAKAIQFLLMPLYTTYMTTEAYGVAELTNNLSELFFPIATLCIYEAAFRYSVDPDFDNIHLATSVAKVYTRSIIGGFAITCLLRFAFNYKYSYYLFFILYSYSMRMCAAYYIRGLGKSKIFAFSGVLNAITLSIFDIIFLVVLKSGIEGYLLAIGLSYCTSSLYLLIRSHVIKYINFHIDTRSDSRILFRYCTPLIFYNVLYWFTTISGRYILNWFSDASTAGIYVAAIKISAIINMIQQAVYAAFQLNTSRVFNEKNKEDYYSEMINFFIEMYCLFGSLIICFTLILAKITLKGDFYSARIYLPAIMYATIINCISSVLGTMYSTYKKTNRMIGISIVGAVVNIGVGVLLTPVIGIWGVVIASVLCYSSQMVYKFIDVSKFCKLKYNWKSIIPNILLLTLQSIAFTLLKDQGTYVAVAFFLILIIINWYTIIKIILTLKAILKDKQENTPA